MALTPQGHPHQLWWQNYPAIFVIAFVAGNAAGQDFFHLHHKETRVAADATQSPSQQPPDRIMHSLIGLKVPVPLTLFGGVGITKAQFFEEQRKMTSVTTQNQKVTTSRAVAYGVHYVAHAKEGTPHFFLDLEQIRPVPLNSPIPPVSFFGIGTHFDPTRVPALAKFGAGNSSQTSVRIQAHRDLGGVHGLIYLRHRIQSPAGYFLFLDIPRAGACGWRSTDFEIFVKAVRQEIFLPQPTPEEPWIIGHQAEVSFNLGFSTGISIFLRMAAGIRQEHMDLLTADGDSISQPATPWSPFAQIGLGVPANPL